ncbi:hypothetical protein MUP46_04660 [Patescibacteria group bacterium]|nr:hypothetical protein [Patescibacteria group bacterium]
MENKQCYIYCDKCKKTTRHKQIRAGKITVKMNKKLIAYRIKFQCSECQNIVTFKQKIT